MLDLTCTASDMAIMPDSPTAPACLIIGVDNHVGAYLARLLDARGVALAGVGTTDLLIRLGIADQVTRVPTHDIAAAAAQVRLVFAINDGSAECAEHLAVGIDAAKASARLIHVADVADLAVPSVRAAMTRLASARAAGAEAANVLLESHDSRFGTRDTLAARIIAAAFAAANGQTLALQEIVEPGPRDWGWTPEYVDAVQRLATRERIADMIVASGQTLTAAAMADAAFGYFKAVAADHVRISGTGTAVPRSDPAALKAATGWTAYTHGPDLIRALCEGAVDRN